MWHMETVCLCVCHRSGASRYPARTWRRFWGLVCSCWGRVLEDASRAHHMACRLYQGRCACTARWEAVHWAVDWMLCNAVQCWGQNVEASQMQTLSIHRVAWLVGRGMQAWLENCCLSNATIQAVCLGHAILSEWTKMSETNHLICGIYFEHCKQFLIGGLKFDSHHSWVGMV